MQCCRKSKVGNLVHNPSFLPFRLFIHSRETLLTSTNDCDTTASHGHVTHLSVVRIHDSLTGGTNGDWSLHISISGLSHPCHLSSKALHMILLSFQRLFCHKEREIGVIDACLLDAIIEPALNDLPYLVCPGSEYVTACIVACISS